MKHKFLNNLLACLILPITLFTNASIAEIIFEEDFNDFSGGTSHNGAQFQSGLDLNVGLTFQGWGNDGRSHGVILDNTNGANMAAMIWVNHALTLNSGISDSNIAGTSYDLSFQMSAAVYAIGTQTTTADDGMYFDILRTDGSMLASQLFKPGAWTGNISFQNASLNYIGDGSGDVRIRVRSSLQDGHFSGAVDNLTLHQDGTTDVPEPSTLAIFTLGIMGLTSRRFKKQA